MTQQILVIDDNIVNLQVLATILSRQKYRVQTASDGIEGLQLAYQHHPDLILLDINMPEMDGYEVCIKLKANPQMADIPILFISANHETFDKLRAFEVGGVDYITKPIEAEEVLVRVKTHLNLYQRERELAQMMQEQQAYFEQVAALKNEFFSSAVHDLKNPLSLIVSNVYLLNNMVEPEGEQLLQGIEQAATFMNTLVGDMLDLARIESGIQLQQEDVLLNPFLKSIFQSQIRPNIKKHQFKLNLPEQDTIVLIDTSHMERAIINVLSNAIKYTPNGGTITLSATLKDETYTITIADNGIGIPHEAIPHLFDKFYRVPHDTDEIAGTGLGMSIVKAVIDQHHGKIEVESTEQQGTTIRMILPLDD